MHIIFDPQQAAVRGTSIAHCRKCWDHNYRDLSFIVRPTGFKHTGLFPEQAVNWDFMHNYVDKYVKKTGRPFRVLNLLHTQAAQHVPWQPQERKLFTLTLQKVL